MRTKTQGPELEANTGFNGLCSDLVGGPRDLEAFVRMMRDPERYLGLTYSRG